MTVAVGIGLAFVAMLCWGFGDFFIQKSTRKMGDLETLFLITLFGAVVLLPFVWKNLGGIFSGEYDTILILLGASTILFVAALFDFEALKRGKLAVVEPIWSFEVPAAAILAFVILRERISGIQILLIAALVVCLILVAFKEKKLKKSFFMEKGVIVAIFGAVFMGSANFFMGWGGRVSDPLMINFISDTFIMIVTGIILISERNLRRTFRDSWKNLDVLLPMSIADKAAWVAFVFAMSLAPIAIATALSESYIIIAVLLGLFINREKVQKHQKVGLVGAVMAAVLLAVISS